MVDYFSDYLRYRGISNIVLLDFLEDQTVLQAKASLVVGRGSFTTMAELAALGTPSLQILNDHNPVDTFHARNFEMLGTARLAKQSELSPATLASTLEEMLNWAILHRVQVAEAGKPYRNLNAAEQLAKIVGELLH